MASWSQIGQTRGAQSVQAATDSAPSLASDGLALYGLASYLLTVSCDPGQSFSSTAGELDLYHYDDNTALWTPVFNLEETVPVSALGKRSFALIKAVPIPRGRLAHVASGLSISAGQITLTYTPVLAVGPLPPG